MHNRIVSNKYTVILHYLLKWPYALVCIHCVIGKEDETFSTKSWTKYLIVLILEVILFILLKAGINDWIGVIESKV